ncbi:MAG TPA: cyclic nucleotide-binding domain-containing protein [Thermoleophilaceae bacterium]|nr:cyclic nucleotide-binding domain-containing protein [Thermoleophilaceae bacterium]
MDEARLRGIDLFAPLSRNERQAIASRAEEVDVDEGVELVTEGDFAYEFFVIVDGSAEVVRDGRRIADLGPGDFLGEMGIVNQARRNATVVARSPMQLIVMTGQDFRGMEIQAPDVAERIGEEVERRCEVLQEA